jgi:ribosomal protein S18 acetylase RimI-like enzyme
VRIVDYDDRFGDAFARLNREWLEEYFHVESIDREMLSDPQSTIIDPGGAILYALSGTEVLGTVALKCHGDGIYELTKMAVTACAQGRGMGRILLCAALARFRALHGKTLYLESHSSLSAALTLYESAGFVHEPSPRPSEYERADVYMVYRPN